MVKCMVFMHRWCCRDHANYYMSKLQFDKYALLSRKGFCWDNALLSSNCFRCKYAPFGVCLVQIFTQTFRIWLRFCADIWTKNRRLASLVPILKYTFPHSWCENPDMIWGYPPLTPLTSLFTLVCKENSAKKLTHGTCVPARNVRRTHKGLPH